MEQNNRKADTLAFCLGILLTGMLIQAAGWLKGDRLVFPDVGEILAAFARLLGTGKVWLQIGTTLLHLAEALAVSSVIGIATSLMLIPLISEATCEGFLRIEPELVDVYRMNSGFTLRVLLQVYLPLMAGYLKQAYANAVGMGIKLAVTTEYLVQARDSLGKAVYTSSYFNEYAEIYAYALIMILMAVLISGIPKGIGRIYRRSHP